MEVKNNKNIFVGISGGVDSSVALALLQEAGYNVTGVFIKIWHKDISACDWKHEMHDAMRVCAALNVPFKMIDLSDAYLESVISYLLETYKAGQTPNPDVMCNSTIKFGAFYEWARAEGAEYVATGHYAQIANHNDEVVLMRGIDKEKDQSYFLWKIKKEQFQHILFPVGSYTKPEIRTLAKKYNLPTATKPDSQGLCFIGALDIKSFLKKYIKTTPGDVLDNNGIVIGRHDGAELYTQGERHGFVITNKTDAQVPHYVIKKDIVNNTIIVSKDIKKEGVITKVILEEWNQLIEQVPRDIEVQVRYHGLCIPSIFEQLNGNTVQIIFKNPQPNLACGQSVVVYSGQICVGGGVIKKVE